MGKRGGKPTDAHSAKVAAGICVKNSHTKNGGCPLPAAEGRVQCHEHLEMQTSYLQRKRTGEKNLSAPIQSREVVTPDYGTLDTDDRTDPRKVSDAPRKPGKSRGSEQDRFSKMQRRHYLHRCTWTGLESNLEAMHFRAVSQGGKYHPGSGMLAAGFLNKAWDDLVWAMNPDTFAMEVDPALQFSPWGNLNGLLPRHLPLEKHQPNRELLREHYLKCLFFWDKQSTSGRKK